MSDLWWIVDSKDSGKLADGKGLKSSLLEIGKGYGKPDFQPDFQLWTTLQAVDDDSRASQDTTYILYLEMPYWLIVENTVSCFNL